MDEDKKKKKSDLTTIQVSKRTLSRLRAFKIIRKESYDELLNRLLNQVLGGKKG